MRPELTRAAVTSVRLLGGVKVLRGLVGTLEACRSLRAASSLWVVVNKHRPLSPLKYVPSGLVVPASPIRRVSGCARTPPRPW